VNGRRRDSVASRVHFEAWSSVVYWIGSAFVLLSPTPSPTHSTLLSSPSLSLVTRTRRAVAIGCRLVDRQLRDVFRVISMQLVRSLARQRLTDRGPPKTITPSGAARVLTWVSLQQLDFRLNMPAWLYRASNPSMLIFICPIAIA